MYQITSIPAKGEISANVKVLQQALNAKEHDAGDDDGIWGTKTTRGLIEAQQANGTAGTGIIGPKTLDYLGIKVAAVSPVTNQPAITQDMIGKKDRRIHPTMRLMIESHLFPNGNIGKCWIEKNIPQCFIEVCNAMEKIKIVESGGNNRGREVGMIQDIIGPYAVQGDGAAWCLSLGQHPIAMIEDFFQVESPVIESEHCVTTANAALKVKGLVSLECESGTLALAKHGNGPSGHAMPVVAKLAGGMMKTYEGNTSISSIRDGDGSGFKQRNQKKNGDLTTIAFVRVYPYNKLPEIA